MRSWLIKGISKILKPVSNLFDDQYEVSIGEYFFVLNVGETRDYAPLMYPF